ncbi:hypothetical protein BBP40_008731 [Aspergillus hancockii]|nr:hypothetical protein BBP40_008731 [Aspergillus hancockii]
MAQENNPLLIPQRNRHRAHWILSLVCTVIAAVDFGIYLSVAPQTQILEDIICRDLHPDAVASSHTCKNIDVQSELALINGWKETFDQLPGILLALPFGFMADRASILISLKGAINLILLLLILPSLYHFLEQCLPPARKDLLVAQVSAAFFVLGFTLAPHPFLFSIGVFVLALGWGFYFALRSVASALVSETQIGLLNTTIAFVQGVGGVVAGPALAGAFNYGMSLWGAWIGLPYLLGAGLILGAGFVTWGVTLDSDVVI